MHASSASGDYALGGFFQQAWSSGSITPDSVRKASVIDFISGSFSPARKPLNFTESFYQTSSPFDCPLELAKRAFKVCNVPQDEPTCIDPMDTVFFQTEYFTSTPYYITCDMVPYSPYSILSAFEDYQWDLLERQFHRTKATTSQTAKEAATLAIIFAQKQVMDRATQTSTRPSSRADSVLSTSSPRKPSSSSTSTSSTPQRRSNAWTAAENSACIALMKRTAASPLFAGKETRFDEVSRLMWAEYGFWRPNVKNQWNRYLRVQCGFEDRGEKKRALGLVTSSLGGAERMVEIGEVVSWDGAVEESEDEVVFVDEGRKRKGGARDGGRRLRARVVEISDDESESETEAEDEVVEMEEDDAVLAARLQAELNRNSRRSGRR